MGYHSATARLPHLGPAVFSRQMSSVIDSIERAQLRDGLPKFAPGDRVRVHFQVVEGTRSRIQVFEGVVLRRQGSGVRETFTVRKQSFGVGVERTFPLHSPKIEKLEVAARGDVRRAKLYYLRGRIGKAARVANTAAGSSRSKVGKKGGKGGDYDDWTKTELMDKARKVGITGRSSMSKSELVKALRNS